MKTLATFALLAFMIPALAADDPPAQAGVEVQARGPIHEAFASPSNSPVPGKPVPKKPPAPIDEMPPAEKPEGSSWIGGYWAWDDDRSDFFWVSGVWRVAPANKSWVAGYWRQEGEGQVWVGGFWAPARAEAREITYLPAPPEMPRVADPGPAPGADRFYIPGSWVWMGGRYRWRAGYWARVQLGQVWVPDHYRWTPSGHVFVAGYWDLALSRRGVLYAPVIIEPRVITAGFVYTPAYAVRETVLVEAMFVRPAACHYYFGDYYGPRYTTLGFESAVVYSRRCYDPIVFYEARRDPAWLSVQVRLFNDRQAGRAPLPPRTLVQQNTYVKNVTNVTNITQIRNTTLIAPVAQVASVKGTKLAPVSTTARQEAKVQAAAIRDVATRRMAVEVKTPPGAPPAPRTATLTTPKSPQPARIERPVSPVSRPTPLRPPAKSPPRDKDKDRKPVKP